jgi:hypothetical protein
VTLFDALAIGYLACFQLCAWPAIVKLRRRKTSADLATGREWLLLAGVAMQFTVMLHDGVTWRVWVGPVMSATSISILLWHVYRYRRA